jgi:hypothetical protein
MYMGELPTKIISMTNKQRYLCPVCGYPDLDVPPYDEAGCATFNICPCCGTEFGYDDAARQHAEIRKRWIGDGMRWWSGSQSPPRGWDPESQLERANLHDR